MANLSLAEFASAPLTRGRVRLGGKRNASLAGWLARLLTNVQGRRFLLTCQNDKGHSIPPYEGHCQGALATSSQRLKGGVGSQAPFLITP